MHLFRTASSERRGKHAAGPGNYQLCDDACEAEERRRLQYQIYPGHENPGLHARSPGSLIVNSGPCEMAGGLKCGSRLPRLADLQDDALLVTQLGLPRQSPHCAHTGDSLVLNSAQDC